jgi:Clostripain family.
VYIDNYDSAPTLWQLKKTKNNKVQMKSLKTYDEQNSLDTDVMSSIIRETFSEFKADEKYLLLWSHGSGWLPSKNFTPNKAPMKRSFGVDARPATAYQEIWDLRSSIEKSGVYFDAIIFDACHMASVEVAYELKEVTDYLIASPTEVQGRGFPYADLAPLFGMTQLAPQRICEAYMNYYDGSSPEKTGAISLISTAGLDELASCIFFLRRLYTFDINCIYSTQQYGRSITGLTRSFYDLKDLYAHLPLSSSDMTRLEAALSRVVFFLIIRLIC